MKKSTEPEHGIFLRDGHADEPTVRMSAAYKDGVLVMASSDPYIVVLIEYNPDGKLLSIKVSNNGAKNK